MQTPGEKHLINRIIEELQSNAGKQKIVDIGAGPSTVIVGHVAKQADNFICDRVDISDCQVNHPLIGKCIVSGAESMPQLKSDDYSVAFSNYVLEHIPDLKKAAKEIKRVLKPGGIYVASIPNPGAPEFLLAKITPTWFHQKIKGKGEGKEAYDTYYNYKNIKQLIQLFEESGFQLQEAKYYAFTYGYLYRFPIINLLSKAYDKIVSLLNIKALMGNVCLVFKSDK